MIALAPQLTQRTHAWMVWKAIQYTKGLIHQYEETATEYTIWGYDGPEIHLCYIWKGEVPHGIIAGGYAQAQNDSDKTDWETNYKPASNWPIEKREKDGRLVTRISTAVPGRRYRLRAFYFKTALPSSLKNLSAGAGVDLGDVAMKCYDTNDADVTSGDLNTAVKTTIAFEALVDIEMIGGWLEIDPTLAGGATDEWWMSVLAAPDVPAQYGGNVDYLNKANLEMIANSRVSMDGRASAVVQYDPVYHSGKLLFIIKHPAGASKRFQMFIEHFR